MRKIRDRSWESVFQRDNIRQGDKEKNDESRMLDTIVKKIFKNTLSKFVQDFTMNFPDNQMLDPFCTCTLVSASISLFNHVIYEDNE